MYRELNNQKDIEELIIDLNNNLFELSNLLSLDIAGISKINKKSHKIFDDNAKKNIISSIELLEKVYKEDEIYQKSIEAAGILDSELKAYKDKISKPLNNDSKEESIKLNTGEPPPKIEWERVGMSNDEKEKIIKSIRANPGSNIFSKEFKWNPKDFLSAFLYLEENKKYNGPFLISVVSDKIELEKYSKIENLHDSIYKINFGKFVLLSIYDITASNNQTKNIYIGLDYIGMTGRLEFFCLGSDSKEEIKDYQKRMVMEYMDIMDIIYNPSHKDLKII